jgi:hypothetical protein
MDARPKTTLDTTPKTTPQYNTLIQDSPLQNEGWGTLRVFRGFAAAEFWALSTT